MSPVFKKTLSIGIRVLIAVVGLSLAAYSMNLGDQVQMPQGYFDTLSDQTTTRFEVTSRDENTTYIAVEGQEPYAISNDAFTQDESGPWYKPGLKSTLAQSNIGLLVLAFFVILPIFPIQTFRWWLLMRCRDLPAPMFRTFKIHMVGAFYNTFMPGTTGGDLIKAYYTAKGQENKTVAVMSVIVDRIIGLVALVLLGALTGLLIIHHEAAFEVSKNIWILTGIMFAGMFVYFSQRIRKALGINWLLTVVPGKGFFAKIDEAATAYRGHLTTIAAGLGMSIPTHFFIILSAIISAKAVGVPVSFDATGTSFFALLAIFPVIFLIGAIPISMMGFGVMEPVGIRLLDGMAGANEVFMTLVLVRVFMALWSACGAIFMFKGDLHMPGKAELDDIEQAQIAETGVTESQQAPNPS